MSSPNVMCDSFEAVNNVNNVNVKYKFALDLTGDLGDFTGQMIFVSIIVVTVTLFFALKACEASCHIVR